MDASMIKGVIFRNMFLILGQCHVGRNYALQYKVLYQLFTWEYPEVNNMGFEHTDTKLSCTLESIINLFDPHDKGVIALTS